MSGKIKKVATPPAGPSPKGVEHLNPSLGFERARDYPPTKTSGIRTRGNGAATKGVTARGPMA